MRVINRINSKLYIEINAKKLLLLIKNKVGKLGYIHTHTRKDASFLFFVKTMLRKMSNA